MHLLGHGAIPLDADLMAQANGYQPWQPVTGDLSTARKEVAPRHFTTKHFPLIFGNGHDNSVRMNIQAQDRKAFEDWQAQSAASIAESPSHVYRECALAMMRTMHLAIAWTSESQIKAWGVMFAIGHPYCMGKSMSEVAASMRVSRATISNAATEFCKAAQIPPSTYMKNE